MYLLNANRYLQERMSRQRRRRSVQVRPIEKINHAVAVDIVASR